MEIVISVLVGFILGMFFESLTHPRKKEKQKKRKAKSLKDKMLPCGSISREHCDLACIKSDFEDAKL